MMQNNLQTMNGLTEHDDSEAEFEELSEGQEEFEEVVTESEDEPDELDYDVDIEGDESEYIDECPVDITHFDLIKKLGSGAYGTVFLVQKNCGIDAKKIYALKVISKAEVVKVPKTIVHMKAERKALELLRNCPYIQKLYYAFQTAEKLFLVTEYLPGGEMFTQVQKGKVPEEIVRFYIAELILALEHIHLQGIVYRDIKLENVLIDAEGHVKLVDFGLCKKLGARGRSKSFCGTEEYMAPEVIACTGHNTAADWWALGVLAIELLSTMTPFGGHEGENATMNRITNNAPLMPADISAEMTDFLERILEKDPNDRLGGSDASATKLKQHILFAGLDWDQLERRELPSPKGAPEIRNPFDTQHFSDEFTRQEPRYEPSEPPLNSFLTFKGYSYIAPELQLTHLIDENWNSMIRLILSNRDPDSEFHRKYNFASYQPLGPGKSSVCVKCLNLSDKNHYAVKIYKRTDQNDYEIAVLQRAADPRIPGVVQLVEVLTDSKWTYLVMELIEGVNLFEHFSTMPLPGAFLYEVVSALYYMVTKVHELKYTHGRICFKNIYYLQQSSELRLIGFGNAKPLTRAEDAQIDYWSMGVCIYTLLCGHSPFSHFSTMNPTVLTNRIESNEFDEDSKQWSALHKDVRSCIEQLLRNWNPDRDGLDALKKAKKIPYRGIDWSQQRLDENESIVEIRATKMETQLHIKNEFNGIETNGNESAESQTNGDVQNLGRKRKLNPVEGTQKKVKVEPPSKRDLRTRKPKNTQPLKPNQRSKHVTKVEIIQDDKNVPLLPNPVVRSRGRPRKVQKLNDDEAKPIATRPAATPKTRTKQPVKIPELPPVQMQSAQTPVIESMGHFNWVYGWRPNKKVENPFYCFHRFDYEGGSNST